MPYLLSMGIFAAAVIFGAAIVRQINDDRNALEALRVELERRVMERTAELERSNAELSRAERMAVVGKLAAGIAHELNNPSAAIRASLEDARNELLRSGRTAEVLACVDISLAAVDRVTRIVRQFGAMAGGAESQDTSPVASADLAVAVQAAVKAARDASRPDLAITVRVDGGLWVRGMAAALQEAVAALVSNAVEAIPDGQQGHVEVTAAQDGEWVDLTVRDSGTGMHDDVMARAFEPFFSTKEIGPSSGLGLPVAKGLVETMGGTLKLKSIVGIGTEAAIRLRVGPVCESTSGGKSRPGKADQGTAASAPSARTRPRILLVDDDDLVRVAMQRYLSRDFDVDTAASVRDGLAMADRRYDVILSDVVMPDGGGQRFLRDLTARDPDLAARVIFVTGGSFRGAVQDFLQTQAQPVLNKPVRLSELKAAILRLMSPPAPPAE
jgi:signal transduction histidine kinase/CheY-like chemotaxis protein